MRTSTGEAEHVDVLIVGAGLSGIGAACHLRRECPQLRCLVLEAREATGGTWDLFRYPGVRSDSDMHTLGYSFAPWEDPLAIADGPSILAYIRRAAARFGVDGLIRLGHRVTRASFSSERARWTVWADRTDTGDAVHFSCSFLLACTGYYRYDHGYVPELAGAERFPGPIVHPQSWPEGLDYEGKRVVVIGSGATAVTLVPAMAAKAGHVTMLQRSPSYMVSLPSEDSGAERARRWLPPEAAYRITRARNIALMMLSYQACRRWPDQAKKLLRRGVAGQLPAGFDVDAHFKPAYDPWDQRLCVCPDGDLFSAVRAGRASIVTDRIETLTERGVALAGGGELQADLIVTATGLELLVLGGIELQVDGEPVRVPERTIYKGAMLSGVPNFALTMGYTNASWTLKCDLICGYVCRLLRRMGRRGAAIAVPRQVAPPAVSEPLLNLQSGYVLRSVERFPRQGLEHPWRTHQNYVRDLIALRLRPLEDGALRLLPAGAGAEPGLGIQSGKVAAAAPA